MAIYDFSSRKLFDIFSLFTSTHDCFYPFKLFVAAQ